MCFSYRLIKDAVKKGEFQNALSPRGRGGGAPGNEGRFGPRAFFTREATRMKRKKKMIKSQC